MTNVSSTRRAVVAALVVALVLAVVGVAVGAATSVPGTRVRAHDQPTATVVAASATITAGQGRAATTEAAKEVVGSRVAPRAVTGVADDLGALCRTNSFVPATLVLMADGTTKRIADVQVGDMVMATDPETGERGPRRVTDTIVGDGIKELIDVEIDGQVITATDRHPFWVDDEGRWVDAEDLEAGDVLLLAGGGTVTVDTVRERSDVRRVHNLTVDGIHTYYVVAGDDPVLVPNCRRPTAATRQAADDAARGPDGTIRCQYCGDEVLEGPGSPLSREYDQMIPHAQGGGREIDNIVVSCRTCNRQKGGRTPAEWGWPWW